MSKKDRLQAILDIISKYEIDTQELLTSKLNSQGFNVSQATVSRDINELNIIKVNGISKKFKLAQVKTQLNPVPDKIISLFKQVTLSITEANNLIVIKTLSGNASTAAMVIDELRIPQIIGTIAGDDTLLVIAKNSSDAEIILKNFRTL